MPNKWKNGLGVRVWRSEDKTKKITIIDIIQELDKQKVLTKEVPVAKLKDIIIDQHYDDQRLKEANLEYPIIVVIKNKQYAFILDGNHRTFKALQSGIKTVKVRELDFKTLLTEYEYLFDYNIKTKFIK
jgi:hypothetical protein